MFIDRENEIKRLLELKNSKKAELAIIYGRRRVGKSTLLETVATKKGSFYLGYPEFEHISLTKQDAENKLNQLLGFSNWEISSTPIIEKKSWSLSRR